MKKIIVAICIFTIGFGLFSPVNAQEEKKAKEEKVAKEEKKATEEKTKAPEIIKDRLMIDLFHSCWLGVPAEVKNTKFNPGMNVSFLWDIKTGKKSAFSFGIGLGYTYNTFYSNAIMQLDKTEDVMKLYVLPYDTIAKRNRLSNNSLNIPFEIRYRAKSGFKLNVGVRVGWVLRLAHSYKGLNPDGSEENLSRKSFDIYHKQKFHFDVYLRTGWKYVGVYVNYQLTPLFENKKGPKMTPLSIGVTWNIF